MTQCCRSVKSQLENLWIRKLVIKGGVFNEAAHKYGHYIGNILYFPTKGFVDNFLQKNDDLVNLVKI